MPSKTTLPPLSRPSQSWLMPLVGDGRAFGSPVPVMVRTVVAPRLIVRVQSNVFASITVLVRCVSGDTVEAVFGAITALEVASGGRSGGGGNGDVATGDTLSTVTVIGAVAAALAGAGCQVSLTVR